MRYDVPTPFLFNNSDKELTFRLADRKLPYYDILDNIDGLV